MYVSSLRKLVNAVLLLSMNCNKWGVVSWKEQKRPGMEHFKNEWKNTVFVVVVVAAAAVVMVITVIVGIIQTQKV